ncbi:MAG: reverse transcriptase-like protein [Peptoniphilaceae bacterium]|nr:reverse transcriptase-like protein [Peptoniphilaceae bacterium]MDY6085797.1 RNase H family protein [Peptoniphilaceae bacterium]
MKPPAVDALPENTAVAYVDGSYNVKTRIFGYGIVYFSAAGKETFSGHGSGPYARHRNVAGEVLAAMQVMKLAKARGIEELWIYHDYAGVRHWALGEWKAKLPMTQQYKAYAEKMQEALHLHFVKVAAHTGETYNEEADQLAKKGAGLKGGAVPKA